MRMNEVVRFEQGREEVAGCVEFDRFGIAQDFEVGALPDPRKQILAERERREFKRVLDPAERDIGWIQLADGGPELDRKSVV